MTATAAPPRKSEAAEHAHLQRQKQSVTSNTTGFSAPPLGDTFGHVIAWDLPPAITVQFSALIQALRDHGLDEAAVRERLPRHAFARACKNLAEQRVIRKVREDETYLWFQFTKEERTNDQDCPLAYNREALLRLSKNTGDIDSDAPELTQAAKQLLDTHLTLYTTGDVTACLQRLFDREAGLPGTALFSFKRGAGVYFVPQDLAGFLDKVDGFVGQVGGALTRWPIYKHAGDPVAAKSVREAMAEGLAQLVKEYEEAVAAFGKDTRDSTLERAAERVQLARFKVEAYAEYLGERQAELLAALNACAEKLRGRVASIGECRAAEYAADCDFCKTPQPVDASAPRHVCVACGKAFAVTWN